MPEPGDRLDLALREAARVLAEGQAGGSIVVLADAVDTDPAAMQALQQEISLPVQFLAINAPDSSQDESLRAAARVLKASVEPLDVVEGQDIAAIVRRAASTPLAQRGEQGGRWQEAGYWLTPLIGLIVLAAFRREHSEDGPA